MKNIRIFLSENFHFLVVKFSVYLNRHVFVMIDQNIGHSPYYFLYEPCREKTALLTFIQINLLVPKTSPLSILAFYFFEYEAFLCLPLTFANSVGLGDAAYAHLNDCSFKMTLLIYC